MLLSTQTKDVFATVGVERGIRMIAEAGYDAIDLTIGYLSDEECSLADDSYIEFGKRIRRIADECGVVFNQAHAPTPSQKYGDDVHNAIMIERMPNAIRLASIVGAKNIIIHPSVYPDKELEKKENLAFYRYLEPTTLECGIKIAIENMWDYDSLRGHMIPCVCSFSDDLIEYYEELNPEAFTVCLDIGHGALIGENSDAAIRNLGGKRLTALHVHDNDYRDDLHTAPFLGKFDWEKILCALGEIDYRGDFTYEPYGFLNRFPAEYLPHALKFMAGIGREMISKIESYRKK